jgi:hypothetical protein
MTYPHQVAFGDEGAETVFERYHQPGLVLYNDGLPLDRERLLAHVRPARRRVSEIRVDVHDAVVDGNVAAARYTLTAVMRNGTSVATEIYMFGQVGDDGRLARVDQATRDLTVRSDRAG